MLATIVLICSAATAPADCTAASALDVMHFPPERAAICAPVAAQATVARMAIKPEAGKSYVKTACVRVK